MMAVSPDPALPSRPKLACVGLGPIGLEAARAALRDDRFEVDYAVDPAPALAGQSLRQLLGESPVDKADLRILGSIEELPHVSGPSVALLCTGSRLAAVAPQIRQLTSRGWNVVTTTEELVFPAPSNRTLWDELDTVALRAGVSVLGVGINPGFVMDLLPAVLAMPCLERRQVLIRRRVDASRRRQPLQAKVGVGLTEAEFHRRVEANQIGHIGLPESAHLLAACLGWELVELDAELAPVLDPGGSAVIGLKQRLHCSTRDGRELLLELAMHVGMTDECDEIRIEADPPVNCIVRGGYHGDRATVAMVLNSAIPALRAAPGLRTVAELPLTDQRHV
jgi:2,4-diaminopentanoate dehydrogenase